MSSNETNEKFYLNAFIKTSQYFATLPSSSNVLVEAPVIIVRFFGAFFSFMSLASTKEKIETSFCFPKTTAMCESVSKIVHDSINGVFQTGYLDIATVQSGEDARSILLLPIEINSKTEAVLVIAFEGMIEFSHEILNIYLALSSIISATRQKQLSEFHIKAIMENAGEGIFGLDKDGRHTFVNDAAAKILGYSLPELLGQHSHEVWHHHHKDGKRYPPDKCPIFSVLSGKKTQVFGEEYFIKKSGEFFPVDYVATPLMYNTEANGAVIIFKDISERKKYEEEIFSKQKKIVRLLENEQYLKRILKILADVNKEMIVQEELFSLLNKVVQIVGKYTKFVKTFIFYFEQSVSFASSKKVKNFNGVALHEFRPSPDDIELIKQSIYKSEMVRLESAEQQFANIKCLAVAIKEAISTKVVGSLVVMTEKSSELLNEEKSMLKEICLGLSFKITASMNKELLLMTNQALEKRVSLEVEARQKQERLMTHQSRLAAMGEMIGAIAHQWRQPLNALSIIVQDVQMAYEHDEINDEYLKEFTDSAVRQVMYMSNTIDEFRNFFRSETSYEFFNVKTAIDDTLTLVDAMLRNNFIDVTFNAVDGEEYIAYGSKSELCQVILNLISNSKDAIVERKQVSNDRNNGYIFISMNKKAGKLTIALEDNGGGIPNDLIERIFEPYYTTKEQGKGTGIGLYMSKVIIEDHFKGRLTCQNGNMGAVFKVELNTPVHGSVSL